MSKNVINSVSYSMEVQKFLDENPELSVSKIFQSKIIEIMEQKRFASEEREKLTKAKNIIQNKLLNANEFIEKKGLWEEFCDWESKR